MMNQDDRDRKLRNALRLATLELLEEHYSHRITDRVALMLREDLESQAIALNLEKNPDPLAEAIKTLIFRLRIQPNKKMTTRIEALKMDIN